MKTFLQLVLDHRETNPNRLKEKTGSTAIQSAASRILTGAVKSTKRKTVEPLAKELGVDAEAFLSSTVAMAELARLGIIAPGVDLTNPMEARNEGTEFRRASNLKRARRTLATVEESLWRIAVEAGSISDQKERTEIADLVRLVVDNPTKNAEDQIPIIVRRLSGGSASSEYALSPTGSDS